MPVKSAAEYADPTKVTQTAGVCKAGHAWPMVMKSTAIRRVKDKKHLRNDFNPDVPNCPTCGEEWSYVDPSRDRCEGCERLASFTLNGMRICGECDAGVPEPARPVGAAEDAAEKRRD